jgi:ribosome-interacting GTPase 1
MAKVGVDKLSPVRPPNTSLSTSKLTTPTSSVARTCNLIFIVLDVLKPLGDKAIIEDELEGFGIRLNKKPPAILVRKKDKGGIAITNTVPLTNIDHDEIKAVLSEYKISNADVAIREPNATADDLVDVVEGNR